ncbi:MAG TPA: DUF1573 domain-containing protein [Deltaproteobacteria bacterium]|nr:DUF1573 domain-containing protein [Deltaproteobacteria bacterium]
MFRTIPYSVVLSMFMLAVMTGLCLAAPRIEIAEPLFDAGEVLEGKDVSHEFVLKNIGSDPLIVTVKPC